MSSSSSSSSESPSRSTSRHRERKSDGKLRRHKSKSHSSSRSRVGKNRRHSNKERSRERERTSKESERHKRRSRQRIRSSERKNNRPREEERERDKEKERYRRKERSPAHSRYDKKENRSKESSPETQNYQHSTHSKEDRIQKALKNAAADDEELRINKTTSTSLNGSSFEDQQCRIDRINEIDSGDFVQSRFKSSRSDIPLPKGSQIDSSHASAMFSSTSLQTLSISKPPVRQIDPNDPLQLIHPSLLVNDDEKLTKWKIKLRAMREKAARRRFV